VWADVKKKHASHAVTNDITLGDTASTVEFMGGDVVIVSGSTTGEPPRIEDVQEAKRHCRIPVVLGSGVDASNISRFYESADGFIIGSYFKVDGNWANTVDEHRVGNLMEVVNQLRR
jgi:predicted TIM-barrel enzyme